MSVEIEKAPGKTFSPGAYSCASDTYTACTYYSKYIRTVPLGVRTI